MIKHQFKIGDCARHPLQDVSFLVEEIMDLGEGVRLLGRRDQFGDMRWAREEICIHIKEG